MTVAVHCTTCNGSVSDGDAFCAGCGSPVSAPSETVPAQRSAPAPKPPDSAHARLAELASGTQRFHADAILTVQAPMCPACGHDVRPGSQRCPACGENALALPAQWRGVVGGVHQVRRGVRRRPVVCVGQVPEGLTVLFPDGTTTVIAGDRTAEAPPIPAPELATLRTSPGVLLRLAAGRAGGEDSPWPAHVLREAAVALARTDRVLARLVALDALTLDLPDVVDELGLPTSEARWLCLVHAARRGDGPGAVAHAGALPPGRYRRAVGVLAVLGPRLRTVPDAGQRLQGFLMSHVATEPLAGAVARALGVLQCDAAQVWADAELRAARTPLPSPLWEQVWSLLAHDRTPPTPPDLLGSGGRRLFALLHPASARGLLDADDLQRVDPETLDDIVDHGLVDQALLSTMPPGPVHAHLRARLDPAALTDDEVGVHPGERRRRALLVGGAVPGDERRAEAVTALRDGRLDEVDVDDLDPADRPVVQRLLDGRHDPAIVLDAQLLADRTLWPVLAMLQDDQRYDLRGHARSVHPPFAAWLDLLDAREHLFLARWGMAGEAARRCLAHADEECVRDEALNLLACALHHQGQAAAAVTALEKAIEGEYSTALLANLAVIARELSSEAAAPHLARIVMEARRPGLRRQAALLALRLWRADPHTWRGDEGDQVLPPVLRAPLRSVVLDDMPVDDFRALINVLATKDASWLTTPGVLARSPHANGWEARFAVAAAGGRRPQVDLFAEVTDWATVPPWLVAERDALVEAVCDELLADLDNLDNTAIGTCRYMSQRLPHLEPRQRVIVRLLDVAMTSMRHLDRGEELPKNVVELWRNTRNDVAGLADDKLVTDLEELATRRVANAAALGLERRKDKAIDDYNEWLERVQRTVHYHNQAMDVFNESVRTLTAVRGEMSEWRQVCDHDGTRQMYDALLANVDGAIPHIRRMIMPKLDFLR